MEGKLNRKETPPKSCHKSKILKWVFLPYLGRCFDRRRRRSRTDDSKVTSKRKFLSAPSLHLFAQGSRAAVFDVSIHPQYDCLHLTYSHFSLGIVYISHSTVPVVHISLSQHCLRLHDCLSAKWVACSVTRCWNIKLPKIFLTIRKKQPHQIMLKVQCFIIASKAP